MEVSYDVKHNKVEALVKEMIKGNKGNQMKMQAKEWKKKAIKATDVRGSCYDNFHSFIKDTLQLKMGSSKYECKARKGLRLEHV
ncbi:UDP-glycosyltransferase 85A8 [Camellia lanceoleosa]|uniref:UDP-glycosyltransferase 85A8 n=1 Tax=Camellia lanceoleosa TaxID=1840588 RepID=A0ACC0I3T5_9ERIC|nr:UDP-glycosyltransferase 85A8 [Camellia lanceoleosa]